MGNQTVNNTISTWLQFQSSSINSIAKTLNINPILVAIGPAEEASHIISDGPLSSLSPNVLDYNKNIVDYVQDGIVTTYSSQDIIANYNARLSLIDAGSIGTPNFTGVAELNQIIYKGQNPTACDIGFGNVNLGVAINVVQNYLANNADQFGLTAYTGHWDQFAADLISTNSHLTFIVSGLIAGNAVNFWQSSYPSLWNNATLTQQTQLVDTFYKQGAQRIISNLGANGNNAPDPAAGDGADFVQTNIAKLTDTIGSNSPGSTTTSLDTSTDVVNGVTVLGSVTLLPGVTIPTSYNTQTDVLELVSHTGTLYVPAASDNSISTGPGSITLTQATPSDGSVSAKSIDIQGDIVTDQLNEAELQRIQSTNLLDPNGHSTFTSNGDSLTLTSGTVAGPQVTTNVGGVKKTEPLLTADQQFAAQLGGAFGSAIGQAIGGNAFQKAVAGAVLSTLGSDLGIAAATALDGGAGVNLADDLKAGFANFDLNLQSSGISAVTDLAVADFVQMLGISGPGGAFLSAVAGSAASTIISNAAQELEGVANAPGTFANLGPNIANAVFSWAGEELAGLIIQPTGQDGVIGSEIGSAIGSFIPYVGTFIGDLFGTAIGNLFGEPASPQAWVHISEAPGTVRAFSSVFIGSKQNGPIADVVNLGTVLITDLNQILADTGGTIATNSPIQNFNFGIRQGQAEIDGFGGKTKFADVASALTFAYYKELTGIRITGGDVYKVRALGRASKALTTSIGYIGGLEVTSSIATISGDLAVASEYEKYIADPATIDALIAAAPNSAFSQGWAATLAAAAQLGLDQRGIDDWSAGWDAFLKAQAVDPTQVGFQYAGRERTIQAGPTLVDDTIDSIDKTIIQGSSSNSQTITVIDNVLQVPGQGSSVSANGTSVAAAVTIPIAAMIYGGSGAGDVIWGGNQGNDIFGGNGGTSVTGGADTIYGYSSPTDTQADATWIFGGSGVNDIVAGVSSGDYLVGGIGTDTIDAHLTNSAWLDGGSGNNTLIGGQGNDVITAKGSSSGTLYTDSMIGGGGTDTYIVNIGTADTINNAPATPGTVGGGTIELAGNVGLSQVGLNTVSSNGTINLVISIYAPGTNAVGVGNYTGYKGSNAVLETVTVQNWSNLANRVQYLQTSDGQKIDLANIANIVVGTAGNNYLVGTQGKDAIYGMGGTDTIESFGGGDLINGDGFLVGGTGNDLIFGGSAADTLLGASGSNTLEGGGGNDLILAGPFDTASQTDILQGGTGNDTLIGGSSAGTAAADHNLFEYAAGDGSDLVIAGLSNSAWHQVWTPSGFQPGFARDLSTVPGDTLSGDITLTVAAFGLPAGTPIYYTQPSVVNGTLHAAGTMNGIVDVEDGISNTGSGATGVATSAIYWQPNVAQNAQTVSNLNDTIQFGPSITQSELLFEQQGLNLLIGINDGNLNPGQQPGTFAELQDQIEVENYFSTGSVTGAIGGLAFQNATGSSTTVLLGSASGTAAPVVLLGPSVDGGVQAIAAPSATNTQTKYWITGNAPNTALANGAGDTLTGWINADTIVAGAGNNLLYGGAGNDSLVAGASGIDTLDGGAGADTLQGTGQTFASYQDAAAGVVANLNPGAQGQAKQVVQQGHAANWLHSLGNPLSWSTHASAAPALPAPAGISTQVANTNTGDAAGDVYIGITGLIGSTHNDTLVAAAAGSTLDGGGGSDLLIGGIGAGSTNDFVYSEAYGNDTIVLGGSNDTIDFSGQLGTLATFQTLWFSKNSDAAAPGGVDLLITNKLTNRGLTIEGLAVPGQTLTLSLDGDTSVTFSGIPIGTAAGAQSGFISAAIGTPSTLLGGTGATTILGSTGADSLRGQSGNDLFEGLGGADTITGGNGAGAANNTISFQSQSTSVGATITLNGAGLATVAGDASGDKVSNIQNVIGTYGNDSLTGDANANLITGLSGNDTLIGGGGSDTLIGNGIDIIASGPGNALISVADCTLTGAGSVLTGGAGNDTIYGGAGNDLLTSTAGYSSSLNGGLGNDTIYGNGADTLNGGGGDDSLYAGAGAALLQDYNNNGSSLFGGTGQDTLYLGAGNAAAWASSTAYANNVLESNEADSGSGTTTTVNAANRNWLFGSTLAGPAAGDDTFALNSLSGNTVVTAPNGVNEIQFDGSVNYQNLWFQKTGTRLDIFDIGNPQYFDIIVNNFFLGNVAGPSVRDIVINGEVLFLSQFANSSTAVSLLAADASLFGGAGAPSSIPAALSGIFGQYWKPTATATDTITGASAAANLLIGSKYNNQIIGADTQSNTADTIIAGGGTNMISFAAGAGVGGASIIGGSVADTIYGAVGANTITGGSGLESITGGAGADIITAGSGADTVFGLDGNDTITAGNGNALIVGGGGADSIVVGSGSDTIWGYQQTIAASDVDGADTITTGGGNDLIYTGQIGDTVQINAAATPGNTTIIGGNGNDWINLIGASSASHNVISTVNTGPKTVIWEGAGADTITDGGSATVNYAFNATGINQSLASGVGSAGAAGDQLNGVTRITGSSYADTITGSNAATNYLAGGGGNDALFAGTGSDTLDNGSFWGAVGNDSLIGDTVPGSGPETFITGGGNDTIYGGSGNNTFLLGGGTNVIVQSGRSVAGTTQDLIQVLTGSSGSLTMYGPTVSNGATVSTQLTYQDPTVGYWDVWFAQRGNDLIVTEFGASGVVHTSDLVGWFTNAAIQSALQLQYFGVSGAAPSTQMANAMLTQQGSATGFSTNGSNVVLAVNGLVALDAGLSPGNQGQANALFYGATPADQAYHAGLEALWHTNTPPTLSILGPSTGTVAEQIQSNIPSSLSFTVSVQDSQTLAQNLHVNATSPYGSVSLVNGTISASGIAVLTWTPNANFVLGNAQGQVPIQLSVTDGDYATSSISTYTAVIMPVNPVPFFVLQQQGAQPIPNQIYNEGPTATTKGVSTPVTFYVDDLAPSGADDSSLLSFGITSSNQALTNNSDFIMSSVAGSPTAHQLTLYAEPGQSGSSVITLTASDGQQTVSTSFTETVNQVEIPPTISTVAPPNLYESSSSQSFTLSFHVSEPNGVIPSVSVSAPIGQGWPVGMPWWLQPTLVNNGGGNYTATVGVSPGSWTTGYPGYNWSSPLILSATDGTAITNEQVNIQSIWQHLDFSLPTAQTFSMPESNGVGVLAGSASIHVDSNSDTFTYSSVGNNPNPGFSVLSYGAIYVTNGSIAWSSSGSNSYLLPVQVTNGAYTHVDNVTVNVTDNSPPTFQATSWSASGGEFSLQFAYHIPVSDPHGLPFTVVLSSAVYNSGSSGPSNLGTFAFSGSGTVTLNGNAIIPVNSLVVTATDSHGVSSNETLDPWATFPKNPANEAVAKDGYDTTSRLVSSIASFAAPEESARSVVPLSDVSTLAGISLGQSDRLIAAMASFTGESYDSLDTIPKLHNDFAEGNAGPLSVGHH